MFSLHPSCFHAKLSWKIAESQVPAAAITPGKHQTPHPEVQDPEAEDPEEQEPDKRSSLDSAKAIG